VAISEATGGEFRARAGTLTLTFLTSSEPPEILLELLQSALDGGHLAPRDDDLAPEEVDYEDRHPDYEDHEDDGEYEDEDWGEDPESGPEADIDLPMEATPKGVEGLYVAFTLDRWLRNCPDGPLRIGREGGEAIAALICGWSATVTHSLGGPPGTLAELSRGVEAVSLETLDEHLQAMVRAGLATAQPDPAGETRYAASRWLREGIAPLAAAARFERRHSEPGSAPPDSLDVEAAFQLVLPLLKLPDGIRGSCRLGVQIPGGPPQMAGATVRVAEGRVVSSTTLLEENPNTFVTGSPLDWMDALVNPSDMRLKAMGDLSLVHALLYGLHERLFGLPLDIPK
jgi:DNA-binding HxlR family transcriptional regulator